MFLAVAALSATANANITFQDNRLVLSVAGKQVVSSPAEGLWSVATGWSDDWMCDRSYYGELPDKC